MLFLRTLEFVREDEESWKLTIFGKNGKPIALLLAKICCFYALFTLCLKMKKVEDGHFLAKVTSL